MPEEENKTVDIDTSGPDTEIEIDQSEDNSTEPTATESTEETRTESVAADSTLEASDEEQETEKETSKEASKNKKEELEEYSAGVQRRIAKLTKKMREAERQREEAIRFAEIQKKQREEIAKRYETTNVESMETKATSIKAGIEAAKAKLAQAREAGDLQAEIEAQQSVAQLAYAQAELDFQKRSLEQQSQQVQETAQTDQIRQPMQQVRPDAKAEEWAEKNTWFGQDSAMTYTAFDLHRKLTEEEGYDPKSDEYYAEIDKRIRLEFPHKFAKKESTDSTKPVQTVASAKRSTKPGRKTVRLTSSQVAIAKKLGVPLEEYAKQLKITKEA